jgi:hypothetical protein
MDNTTNWEEEFELLWWTYWTNNCKDYKNGILRKALQDFIRKTLEVQAERIDAQHNKPIK